MVWSSNLSTPYCEVDFHTAKELYSASAGHTSTLQPTSDLLSVNTSKNIAATAGSFDITFKGHDWADKISPQDLVVIKMGRKKGSLDTVMVGLVDEVRRSRRLGAKSEVQKRTVIRGRDMGKVFLKAMIKWFPQLKGNFPLAVLGDNTASSINQMRAFYTQVAYEQGEPGNLMDNAIRNILANLMSFTVKYWNVDTPVDASLKELIRFRIGKANNIVPFATSMQMYEGSLWNFMTLAATPPFHEMFIDTRTDYMEALPESKISIDLKGVGRDSDGWGRFSAVFGDDAAKNVFFFRPTPFDKADWDALLTHDIADTDILDEDIGKADHENYNMFLVRPALNVLNQEYQYEEAVLPRFNADNIKRHGISIMDVSIPGDFGNNTKQKGVDVIKAGGELSDKLKDWYEHNLDYWNGSYGIKGNGKIKVGQRARVGGKVFYIETVNQSFTVFGEWQTTLAVTRGQDEKATSPEKPSITIPGITAGANKASTPQAAPPNNEKYTVLEGDTLWAIASKFYGDGSKTSDILKANPQITDPNLIYTGDVLIIPNPVRK